MPRAGSPLRTMLASLLRPRDARHWQLILPDRCLWPGSACKNDATAPCYTPAKSQEAQVYVACLNDSLWLWRLRAALCYPVLPCEMVLTCPQPSGPKGGRAS